MFMFIYLCLFINDKGLWENSFCLFSVADKILKKKTYPLYMNPKCYQVTVSPFIERRLEKYQVLLPLFLRVISCWSATIHKDHGASYVCDTRLLGEGCLKRFLHFIFAWSMQNEFVFFNNTLMQSCALLKTWCQARWCNPGIPAIQEAEVGGFHVNAVLGYRLQR